MGIQITITGCKKQYKHKHIVERLDAMDEEDAKKALWYLLQICEKSLDCKTCPGKCENPSKGLCMMRILDEAEAIDNAGQDKTDGGAELVC